MNSPPGILSRSQLAQVRRPLAEASLLPPLAYCAPALYEAELVRVLRRNWIAVAHVSELPDTNSYLAREVANEPVLLTRSADQQVRAMSNVCRHRNSLVAKGARHCAADGRLRCPYHRWTYSLDGQLVAAPFMQRTEGFEIGHIRLPSIKMEIWQGFIFVNLDGSAAPLSPLLRSLDDALRDYRMTELDCGDFERYAAPWNWKISLENFSEAYHQIAIHPTTAEPFIPARLTRYVPNDGGPYSLFYMPFEEGKDFESPFPSFPGLSPANRRQALVVNVYPMFHLLIDPSGIYWLDWSLRNVDQHDLVWHLLVPRATTAMGDFGQRKERALGIMRTIWAEDMDACAGVQRGARAMLARPGRMSHMELAVHEFHNWWLNQFQDCTTGATSGMTTV